MDASLSLAAIARAAKLPPDAVIKRLFEDHAVTTAADLRTLLANPQTASSLPTTWREQLDGAMKNLMAATGGRELSASMAAVQWRPNGEGMRPRIVVCQGDLTTCEADAIVNAANSRLSHGGGLAGAIARRGGSVIIDESQAWIRRHRSLPVGKAMVTNSGELPCRYVIHTVGPQISGSGTKIPSPEQAQLLRNAVWSVLCEAEKLELKTIAIPGISSGVFGYPRDLAAREIVSETVRFCRARSAAARHHPKTTTLETIALMNNDTPTCESFLKALQEVAGCPLAVCDGDPFAPVSCSDTEPLHELLDRVTLKDSADEQPAAATS